MRCSVCLVLAACGFQSPIAPDAPKAIADAPSTCRVAATGAVTTGDIIGMGGGSMRDALACDAPDQRIVGLQIEMSDGPANGQSSRSARGIAIGCATVTVDTVGAHDGSVTMKQAEGNGGSGWSPSTWQPYTPCVAGAVVVGIGVHGGAQANESNLMSDVSMSCASLDVTGATTTVTNLPVAGTMPGTGMNPSSYQCPAGQQITEIVPFTGAGLDRLQPSCAAIACD